MRKRLWGRLFQPVPPQNPVGCTIVDVSAFGVELTYPPMLPLLYALLATAGSSLKARRELDRLHPGPRQRESVDGGKVIALPMVGGQHHRHTRHAA